MQAALERYLSDKKYPYSLITGREFATSRAVSDAKAKQLRMNGYGKRQNCAQPYNSSEEELFWSSGLLSDHSGAALTNVSFKNLSEHFGFRGRQDHYDAYLQDFEVVSIQIEGGEMAKCVRFSENPAKTGTGGLTAKHRKTPQEMWAMDGSSRDPVRLFEEFLRRRPSEMRTSGPLHLAIIQRPKTEVWYAKSRMGKHKLGNVMRTLAKTLTRKSVVAKLKKARQPRHKIIQITSHANECSLDDYDEVDEDERRTLPHIISGYSKTSTTTRSSETPPSSSSLSLPPTSAVVVLPSSVSPLSSAAAFAQTSVPLPTYQTSLLPSQMPVSLSANDPAAQHFNNCTVNIQNYFGPQSTNLASSSRVECQIGEIARSFIESQIVS